MIPSTNRPNSGTNLDLSILRIEAQRRLLRLLDKFEGTKTIVWDDRLIGPFEFVANASILRQHDATRLFRLSDVKLAFTTSTDYTLFFIRKDYQVAKSIADILQRADSSTLAKTSIVFVPQRCTSIEKFLEYHKVSLDRLNSIEELIIDLFVLDFDLLSMENEFVYRDLYLNEDYSSIHQIVMCLEKLQGLYGPISCIAGQGKAAKLVCDLLLKKQKLQPTTTRSHSQIHQLVLIDRRIDLVTPLLTQLTYEGLLDEVFGIHHCTINLPGERFSQPEDQKAKQNATTLKTKRFELRSSEELFSKLRDCHINSVADVLKQSARNLQAEYEECNSDGKTIHEMGKIVKRLNNLKIAKNSQSNHVTIAELVNEQTLKPEFIYGLRIEHELLQEEKLNRILPDIDLKLLRQEPPLHILRLICLQSIINNGLKPKICDYYKREIIQNYGDQYLLFLLYVEQANLLLGHERFHETSTFSQLKSRFSLINDNVDECNPNHMSYVYGGYSPLSIVVTKILTQFCHGPLWRAHSESLKMLPEPTVTYMDPKLSQSSSLSANGTLHVSESSGSLANSAAAVASLLLSAGGGGTTGSRVRRNSVTSSQSSGEETRVVLVFFIGGCTFAEISALRFLSQQEENNCEFIIGTTKIINGKTLLKSLWPSVAPEFNPS